MNRISNAIVKMRVKLETGTWSKDELDKLRKLADLTSEEHRLFQERKAIAQMDGRLTLDEAQLIYYYLGNSVTIFNSQDLAVKYVLIMLLKELLAQRLDVIA